jgi:hypothetical protein
VRHLQQPEDRPVQLPIDLSIVFAIASPAVSKGAGLKAMGNGDDDDGW